MKPKIEIEYNGKYPNLCRGELTVILDGVRWEFGKYVIHSGGTIERDNDWNMWATEGAWYMDEDDFPKGFPMEYMYDVINAVNEEIPLGCCGGCI